MLDDGFFRPVIALWRVNGQEYKKFGVAFRCGEQSDFPAYFRGGRLYDVQSDTTDFRSFGSAEKHLEQLSGIGFADANTIVDHAHFHKTVLLQGDVDFDERIYLLCVVEEFDGIVDEVLQYNTNKFLIGLD